LMDARTKQDSLYGSAFEEEYTVSLRDLLRVLWRRLWVIVLAAIVLAGSAVGFDFLRTPVYEASIKILIGQEQNGEAVGNLGSDIAGLQDLTQTMTEAVPTRPIAEEVIRRLDLQESPEEFLANLNVEQIAQTQFMEVSYTAPSPEEAQQIANTVGEVFSEQVSEVSANANAITATVWERAALSDSPASPKPVRDGILALILGGMIGTGLAFLLEQLDDRWRSPEEAEQVSGVPTFGIIPEFRALKSDKKRRSQRRTDDDLFGRLVASFDPTSVASEAYRSLRTSLLYALVDTPPKVIVVTSPGTMEGKSITCANLGVVLAQADQRTLIIDCDLRKPSMHKIFGLRNFESLGRVLVEGRDVPEAFQEPLPGLKVLTTGPLPPNPAEILGSKRFAELISRVRQEYDYVLVDSPPVEPVSDPAILATQGDGVLLVLDSQSTRKSSVRRAMRSLETVGATVLGTVMNNVKASRNGYYGYSYTYK
jgi:capsular exopolysaccharide synthesis family protein